MMAAQTCTGVSPGNGPLLGADGPGLWPASPFEGAARWMARCPSEASQQWELERRFIPKHAQISRFKKAKAANNPSFALLEQDEGNVPPW